ncbi:hypothetical protein AB0M46_13510 [Dactylosporangium sp. NPDC051485]|uniref:hypothetical protein n=1 Tax=Dactylosporangium sp. NPDC051485 TaxID=3154846 RepID=UPI00344654D6
MTTTVPSSTVTRDLHVFHYQTHSTVETILVRADNECADRVPRLHTPAGYDLFREVNTFPTADAAERFVAALQRDDITDPDDPAAAIEIRLARRYGEIQVIRHVTTQASLRAVKIDANNDAEGNPRRGWMIYTVAGRYLGFVNEGYNGPQALRDIGDVQELCTVPTSPRFYRTCRAEPYPINA